MYSSTDIYCKLHLIHSFAAEKFGWSSGLHHFWLCCTAEIGVKPSQYEPLIWFSFIHNWHSALVRLASSEAGNFILSATQPMKCHAGKCAFDERPALRLARINIAPNPTAQTPMDVVLFFYTSPGPQCSPSIILQGSKCPDFVSCTYYLHLLRVEQHYQTGFFWTEQDRCSAVSSVRTMYYDGE